MTVFFLATGVYSVVKFMVGRLQNQYLDLSPTSDIFVFWRSLGFASLILVGRLLALLLRILLQHHSVPVLEDSPPSIALLV